jgi:hypothetical protein
MDHLQQVASWHVFHIELLQRFQGLAIRTHHVKYKTFVEVKTWVK